MHGCCACVHDSTSSGAREDGAWQAISISGPGPGLVWANGFKAD